MPPSGGSSPKILEEGALAHLPIHLRVNFIRSSKLKKYELHNVGERLKSAINNIYCRFLPARRYASAGLCDSDVSVCLSVCPSVCHTPVLCLAERKQDREMYTI